uniref:phage late control D family protein n=1 Tax=Altererythrobacter segetis TaxID=1104773 RepID=UPI00140B051B|nr:contractile injection system protein, VgrG/Pvc8 family [Altererythrobacter segetis]
MALDDPQAVHSTLPTVEIDGQSYPLLSANIVSVSMEESLGGMSSLEMSVTDWVARGDGSAGHGSDSGSPLKLGAGLRMFMGPAAVQAGEVFDGQVTALECETRESEPPLITVIAEDRLFTARRKRRSQLFENKSISDIVNAIAGDHGLTPEVRDGLPTLTATWAQQDETDLAFLRRILARFDGDLQIVGAKLQVGKIGLNQRSALTLTAGSTLESVRVTADVADQVTGAKVTSHDPATGDAITGEAQAQGNGPGQGKTGADVLNDKFAAVAWPLGHYGPMKQAEADAIAQAEYDRRSRAFVRATGTAIGNAQLRVGSWVTLAGVNAQFANDYAVIRCTHRYEPVHGYRTDFVAESAYLGDPA